MLVFPFIPTIAGDGAHGLWSGIGQLNPWKLLRLSLGHAPGDWTPALVLPLGALLGLALARGDRRAPAATGPRSSAWSRSGSPGSPAPGTSPTGLRTRRSYTTAGGCLRGVRARRRARIGVRRSRADVVRVPADRQRRCSPPSSGSGCSCRRSRRWPPLGGSAVPTASRRHGRCCHPRRQGAYNVVWLADRDGQPFPAPGGDPTGVVHAGDATAAYGLTDRGGPLAVDIGRQLTGAGDRAARLEPRRDLVGHDRARRRAARALRRAVLSPSRIACRPRRRGAPRTGRPRARPVGRPRDLAEHRRDAAGRGPARGRRRPRSWPRTTRTRSSGSGRVARGPLAPTGAGGAATAGGARLAVVATAYDPWWELAGSAASPSRRSAGRRRSTASGRGRRSVRRAVPAHARDVAARGRVGGRALWITRKPVRR